MVRRAQHSKPDSGNSSTRELTEMISRACLIAEDAAFNVLDYI